MSNNNNEQPEPRVETVSTPKLLIDELDVILEEMQELSKDKVLVIGKEHTKMDAPRDRNDLINYILWNYITFHKEMKRQQEQSRIILPGE